MRSTFSGLCIGSTMTATGAGCSNTERIMPGSVHVDIDNTLVGGRSIDIALS